jgi:hypothetical protein
MARSTRKGISQLQRWFLVLPSRLASVPMDEICNRFEVSQICTYKFLLVFDAGGYIS